MSEKQNVDGHECGVVAACVAERLFQAMTELQKAVQTHWPDSSDAPDMIITAFYQCLAAESDYLLATAPETIVSAISQVLDAFDTTERQN